MEKVDDEKHQGDFEKQRKVNQLTGKGEISSYETGL
jgi:hypothetical protein